MLSDSISLRGAPLLSSLSERGARASCLELYGAKGFIIAGRVRKGCNHPNYLISDTKVKRYRMSPRSPTIISRLTPCLFSDVNLIDKKKNKELYILHRIGILQIYLVLYDFKRRIFQNA